MLLVSFLRKVFPKCIPNRPRNSRHDAKIPLFGASWRSWPQDSSTCCQVAGNKLPTRRPRTPSRHQQTLICLFDFEADLDFLLVKWEQGPQALRFYLSDTCQKQAQTIFTKMVFHKKHRNNFENQFRKKHFGKKLGREKKFKKTTRSQLL